MPQTLEIQPIKGSGNTLVIPSIYPQQSIIGEPTTIVDTYKDYTSCPKDIDTSCTVVWHDETLGMVFSTSGAKNPDGSISAGVGCGFPGGDCVANCEAQLPPGLIQSLVSYFYGRPLSDKYPPWFLAIVEQNYPGLAEIGLLQPDWWAWLCTPVLINVPGFVPKLTSTGVATCKPPGIIMLVNGVPVCTMDPPTPNPIPDSLRKTLAARSKIARSPIARAAVSASVLAMNPTLKVPVPFHFKACGCADDRTEGFSNE